MTSNRPVGIADGVSYLELREHFRRLGHLSEVAAIVEWDQAVNMPAAAGPSRALAMAGVARLRHELVADPRVGDWLSEAEGNEGLTGWEIANLREMRRVHTRATAIPADLIQASTQADKESEQAWRRCRAENDFVSYAPYLERVVELKRQVAHALAEHLAIQPYDALVDEFEPGITSAQIDALFEPLVGFLPEFTDRVLERQAERPCLALSGPFPIEAQRRLGLQLMQSVGFDMSAGRLDVSHHPFCGGVPRDVRITTRYDEADFTSALMGILHECGHGKYEQGLPPEWEHQPVGLARGMALHESQSLLLEMQVCRGPQFIAFAAPRIRDAFPRAVTAWPESYSIENLTALATRVRRSLIRVDADEVTYPAHVLLRYDLERRLIAGSLRVRELPEAWDDRMRSLLGLGVSGNDKDGCLQDVHWPSGAFGYFPLYTVGAMIAAQLFASAKRVMPTLLDSIGAGDLTPLDGWLRENVWRWASRYSTNELLVRATGESLNPLCFIDHLTARYLES